MYNVVIKSLILISLFVFIACGTSDKKSAENIYEEAVVAVEQKKYSEALKLLDSIDNSFPKEIEIRRRGLNLRPKAFEGQIINDIVVTDSTIAMLQMQYNKLTDSFKKVSDSHLVEPYIVEKQSNDKLFETTGIQSRITVDGEFYLVSSFIGNIKHTSVSLMFDGESVSTSDVKYDGDRNYRINGTETITFVENECDTIGVFAKKHIGKSLMLRFNGDGSKTINLSVNEVNALARTYEYSKVISDLKSAIRQRDKLEQLLALARDQKARTLEDEATGNK